MRRSPTALAICALTALLCGPAYGAGMFVTPHGARPLSRGGAFTAGADDLNAIYYNPAGVADIDYGATGWSGLLDAGLVLQSVTYTRNENGIMRPPVTADQGAAWGVPLAIPQFGFAKKLRRSWGSMSFGFGMWIPYTGLPRYPAPPYLTAAPGTPIDLSNVPNQSPTRYALLGLHDGSLTQSTVLAVLNPVASFSLLKDRLLVGVGPQLMLVYFRTRLMLSACHDVTCRPEQPDYDSLAVAQAFAVTPSFNVGVIGKVLPWLRLGAAFQFPFFIRSATGSVDARLPPAEFFNGATVSGRDATLALNLPATLRLGAELRLLRDRLRIELAYTLETWSLQQDITFTPQNIALENVIGIGHFELGPIALKRLMQDTHTIHLGVEWMALKHLTARLGGMYETNSTPDSTITVITPDNVKGMFSVGLAVPAVRFASTEWRFEVSYGRIFQPDRVVSPWDSQVYPSNPIRPEPIRCAMPQPDGSCPGGNLYGGIGGGLYQVGYDLIAIGFSAVR